MNNIDKYINIPISNDYEINLNEYQIEDYDKDIIDISNINPRIKYLSIYKKQGVKDSTNKCFVRKEIYDKLLEILDKLDSNYKIVVFDAYRTQVAQKDLYDKFVKVLKEENENLSDDEIEEELVKYVSKPVLNLKRPPAHLTGAAIDLTLEKDGVLLNMGTDFDDFREIAHTNFFENLNITETEKEKFLLVDADIYEIRKNRRLLYNLMIEENFINLKTEWWHYEIGTALWADLKNVPPYYGYLNIPTDILHGI